MKLPIKLESDIKKYDFVDALRGIAIILVVIIHNNYFFETKTIYPERFVNMTGVGARGVQLFYIISAFTLFLSIQSRSQFDQRNQWLFFYIRRFFRIAPLFYLIIFFYVVQSYSELGYINYSVSNLLASFTFTNSFYPYFLVHGPVAGGWSVAIEVVFYCLIPFLSRWITNLRGALWALFLTLFIAKLFNVVFKRHELIDDPALWKHYLFYYFPSHLPAFIMGILMFYIIQPHIFKTHRQESSGDKDYVYPLLALAGFFMAHVGLRGTGIIEPHILFSMGLLVFAYCLFIKPVKLFVNKITVYIGKISYSIYLVHFIVISYMKKYGLVNFSDNYLLDSVLRYSVLLGISIVISSLTYYFVEQKFQKLGKKIILRIADRDQSFSTVQLQDQKNF